jgi:uncharacterized protein (TIGR00255 family)
MKNGLKESAVTTEQSATHRAPAGVRSMTGFARASMLLRPGLGFTITLKSVNHRFLDIQMRLPSGFEALDLPLRNAIKAKMLRGHVDVTLNVEQGARGEMQMNSSAVRAYVDAFRQAAEATGLNAEPDLNAILRLPGVFNSDAILDEEGIAQLERAVVERADPLLDELNAMRTLEGSKLADDMRQAMHMLGENIEEAAKLRDGSRQARFERMQQRIAELTQGTVDADRILQEAALLADRGDIEEEIVRLRTHIQHFLDLLSASGEAGKKLDFLLQEMNREANTLLSKTSGITGGALRVTGLGLSLKANIEKVREQVQNIE